MDMNYPIGLFIVTDPKKQKGPVELFNAVKTAYEQKEDPLVNIFSIVNELSYKDICRRLAAITKKDRYIIRKIYVSLLKGQWPYKNYANNQGMMVRAEYLNIFGESQSVPIEMLVDRTTLQPQMAVRSNISFPLYNETCFRMEDIPGGCEFQIYFYPEKT
jgi:hypothetical protein